MIDRPLPVRPGQRLALRIGDGNHRDIGEFSIQGNELTDIQPPMKGGDMRTTLPPGQRKMQVIAMEVEDIELASQLEDPLHHQQMERQFIHALLVQP